MAEKTGKTTKTRLKNSYSGASEESIFAAIRKALTSHKAKRISYDNDDDGRAIALQFSLVVSGQELAFQLPARVENVAALVRQTYIDARRGGISDERLADQAYRTAWANIRDWVAAQLALVDSGMVRTEEVFLPYLLVEANKTLFEEFAERRALPSPRFAIEEEK